MGTLVPCHGGGECTTPSLSTCVGAITTGRLPGGTVKRHVRERVAVIGTPRHRFRPRTPDSGHKDAGTTEQELPSTQMSKSFDILLRLAGIGVLASTRGAVRLAMSARTVCRLAHADAVRPWPRLSPDQWFEREEPEGSSPARCIWVILVTHHRATRSAATLQGYRFSAIALIGPDRESGKRGAEACKLGTGRGEVLPYLRAEFTCWAMPAPRRLHPSDGSNVSATALSSPWCGRLVATMVVVADDVVNRVHWTSGGSGRQKPAGHDSRGRSFQTMADQRLGSCRRPCRLRTGRPWPVTAASASSRLMPPRARAAASGSRRVPGRLRPGIRGFR